MPLFKWFVYSLDVDSEKITSKCPFIHKREAREHLEMLHSLAEVQGGDIGWHPESDQLAHSAPSGSKTIFYIGR